MQNQYDVTIITVRPATHLKALSVLEHGLANDPALLACWFSEIGALDGIMILRVSAIRRPPSKTVWRRRNRKIRLTSANS